MVGTGKAGISGLIVVGALIYFSGAGPVISDRLSRLDQDCYELLGSQASSIASPVCGVVANGMQHAKTFKQRADIQMDVWWQRIAGISNAQLIGAMVDAIGKNANEFASSADILARSASEGPYYLTSRYAEHSIENFFKRSVDSYAISQDFIKDDGRASQALPWLELGASQPMGYGVMSQIALADLYMRGVPGVKPNQELARQYMALAAQSIRSLQSSNSSQAQLMLKSLGGDPDMTIKQLERIIAQLKQGS